jgi:peptidoglycan/LPS O-acetylase OafA/YrhL
VLSGFVIAYAYDAKLTAGMTFWDFAAKRFIRLYPLIFIGVLLGSIVMITSTIIGHSSVERAIALSLSAVVLFPLGTFLGQQPYPINNPIWSLLFEIIANGVYGLNRGRHKERALLPLIVLGISAASLVVVIRHYGTIERVGFSGRLSLLLGLVRVSYPFLAGVLIYRYRLEIRKVANFDLFLAVLLGAIFTLPFFQGSWIYDSISIIVIFPLVVTMGLNNPTNETTTTAWKAFGNLSYPFYLIHEPIIRAAALAYRQIGSGYFSPAWAAFGTLVFSAAASYVIFVVYDKPVRRRLTMARERVQRRAAAISVSDPA